MSRVAELDQTAGAYDRLAPFYDEFTAGYAHDAWIGAIERRARELGLLGSRALDVACGTGKSTGPLLEMGYSVLGCDISPEMVRVARKKFPQPPDSFFVADMRELPECGEFDLVLCLDDAVNYLLGDDELEAMFEGVAGVLSPTGVFAFDVNSLRTYRSSFTRPIVRERDGLFFAWRGEAEESLEPGEVASATVEIFAERDDGLWERRSSRHVQRHHEHERVIASLDSAGLTCCGVAGQLIGAELESAVDEQRHIKRVYFTRLSER